MRTLLALSALVLALGAAACLDTSPFPVRTIACEGDADADDSCEDDVEDAGVPGDDGGPG